MKETIDYVASLHYEIFEEVAERLDRLSLFRAGTVSRTWRSRFRSYAAFFLLNRNNWKQHVIVGNADATTLLPAWKEGMLYSWNDRRRRCVPLRLVQDFGALFRRIEVGVAIDSFGDFDAIEDPDSCFRFASVLKVVLRGVRMHKGFEQRAMEWMSQRVAAARKENSGGGHGKTTLLFGIELAVVATKDSCLVRSSRVPEGMSREVVRFLQRHRFATVDLFCFDDPKIERFGIANVRTHPRSAWHDGPPDSSS